MTQMNGRKKKIKVLIVLSVTVLPAASVAYRAQGTPTGATRRFLAATYTWVNGSDLNTSSNFPNSTAKIFSQSFVCPGPARTTCEYQIHGLGLADDHSNSTSSFLSIFLDGTGTTPSNGHIEWFPTTQLENLGGSYDTLVPILAAGDVANSSNKQAHQLDIYLTCYGTCETTFRTGHFSLDIARAQERGHRDVHV